MIVIVFLNFFSINGETMQKISNNKFNQLNLSY